MERAESEQVASEQVALERAAVWLELPSAA